MIRIITLLLFVVVTYKFSDWKNWKRYHTSILFLIIGDLLYNVLTYNFPMWELRSFLGGHIINALFLTFILFPCTALLYLTYFPYKKKIHFRILYIFLWVFLYSFIELIGTFWGGIVYFNGWNLLWSCFFNMLLFSILPIHHKRPLLAYGLSAIVVVSFMIYFHVPISSWK